MFSKKKNKYTNEQKKFAIQIMISFVEGRMSVYDFWEKFNNDNVLYDIIYNDEKLPIRNKPFLYDNLNLDKIYHRCEIYRVVKVYFMRRNIFLNFYNKDEMIYTELMKIVPEYIDISQWFIDNILDSCPYSIGTVERKNYIINVINLKYKYKTYPPKWLQDAEWPIVNNEPLFFIKQDKFPSQIEWDDIDISYYFVDDNGVEIVVKQYT